VSQSRRDDDASPERPAGEDDAAPLRRDLRHTVHEDLGVRVERDLSGSSMFLARGSQTHYHKIRFTARGRGTAAEPSVASAQSSAAAADPEQLPTSATASAPASPPATTSRPESAEPGGLRAVLKRLFGL
jgi:hypothetical protein